MATVDAMKIANKEMKKQYKGIDIDKIEVSHLPFLSFPPRNGGKNADDCRASITIWKT